MFRGFLATETRPRTEQDGRVPTGLPSRRGRDSRSTSAGSRPTCSRPTAPAVGQTDSRKPPFVIIQPPPNVTGALHMGHALTSTVEDVMARRARMLGHPTLCLPGVDHASIAAQFVLDRIFAAEGETGDSPTATATSSECGAYDGDARRYRGPASPARRVGRLGAGALHDGRGLGRGGSRRVQAPLGRWPGISRREADELVPGLRHEPVRPRGDPPPPTPAPSGSSATTSSTTRAAAGRRRRSPSPPRARRRSSATPPSRFIRTTRATRP